jgi:hypothetical protein
MSDETPTGDEATRAAGAAQAAAPVPAPHTVSGGTVASPGVGTRTDPDAAAAASGGAAGGFPGADRLPTAAQRPEVLAGAAFGGAFILARILKRIFD